MRFSALETDLHRIVDDRGNTGHRQLPVGLRAGHTQANVLPVTTCSPTRGRNRDVHPPGGRRSQQPPHAHELGYTHDLAVTVSAPAERPAPAPDGHRHIGHGTGNLCRSTTLMM